MNTALTKKLVETYGMTMAAEVLGVTKSAVRHLVDKYQWKNADAATANKALSELIKTQEGVL